MRQFNRRRLFLLVCLASIFVLSPVWADEQPTSLRKVADLSGTWNIAEGVMEQLPEAFPYRVPVPGLVDMSSPDFFEVGIVSARRECFWYQRTFTVDGEVPETALLKIHKAKYGSKVILNGVDLGEHMPCFTPGLFDVTKILKGNGEENELIVRVGAHLESVPKSMPNGWDFEKYKYIPGIYDAVEIILTGTPFIQNIQVAPDIENGVVRVQAELKSVGDNVKSDARYVIREKKSRNIVAKGKLMPVIIGKDSVNTVEFSAPITNARLWSPEDPFLYELELTTQADSKKSTFGMRSFDFDPESGRALLNGKPYYMRGTNVCIYRFFEDAARGGLPWDRDWVRNLHEKFKTMNWNSIRYCIGFPPEFWYDVADEVGFLIQDEFPIWSLSEWPVELKSDAIAKEYEEWMRERWNHPCVVIWDAQNESVSDETGKALQQVRHLDLSNRPWDNGWALPQGPKDTLESHPYFFNAFHWGRTFNMRELADHSGKPNVRKEQEEFDRPIILNEYAWLWIDRNGDPTSLTREAYQNLLGDHSTPDQRREIYARLLAAQTELWRAHRECAAVMHFCGLGYSRPGGTERPVAGATSDNFIDVEGLVFEPYFEKFVKDSFAPVGVMIDVWESEFTPAAILEAPVFVINDLYGDANGALRLRLQSGGRVLAEQSTALTVEPLGRVIHPFYLTLPGEPGAYELIGEFAAADGKTVRSYRTFVVKSN